MADKEMNALLAQLYGTGAASDPDADLTKIAAALVLEEAAAVDEGEPVDAAPAAQDDFTDEELNELASDPDVIQKTAEMILTQRADDEEYMEKFAGYDWAGRIMAHAFNDELEKIGSALGEGDGAEDEIDISQLTEEEVGELLESEGEMAKIGAALDLGLISEEDAEELVKEAMPAWASKAGDFIAKNAPGARTMSVLKTQKAFKGMSLPRNKAAREAVKKALGKGAVGRAVAKDVGVAAGVAGIPTAAYLGLKKKSSVDTTGLTDDEAVAIINEFVEAGGDVDALLKEAASLKGARKFISGKGTELLRRLKKGKKAVVRTAKKGEREATKFVKRHPKSMVGGGALAGFGSGALAGRLSKD